VTTIRSEVRIFNQFVLAKPTITAPKETPLVVPQRLSGKPHLMRSVSLVPTTVTTRKTGSGFTRTVDFDKGAAKKFVLDPHKLVAAA